MEKPIYFIYESCGIITTMVAKHCTINLDEAQDFFNENKDEYKDPSSFWNLYLGEYNSSSEDMDFNSNILRELVVIESTE